MTTIITLIFIFGNTAPSTQTHTFLWTDLLRLWLIGLVVFPVITYFLSRPQKVRTCESSGPPLRWSQT